MGGNVFYVAFCLDGSVTCRATEVISKAFLDLREIFSDSCTINYTIQIASKSSHCLLAKRNRWLHLDFKSYSKSIATVRQELKAAEPLGISGELLTQLDSIGWETTLALQSPTKNAGENAAARENRAVILLSESQTVLDAQIRHYVERNSINLFIQLSHGSFHSLASNVLKIPVDYFLGGTISPLLCWLEPAAGSAPSSELPLEYLAGEGLRPIVLDGCSLPLESVIVRLAAEGYPSVFCTETHCFQKIYLSYYKRTTLLPQPNHPATATVPKVSVSLRGDGRFSDGYAFAKNGSHLQCTQLGDACAEKRSFDKHEEETCSLSIADQLVKHSRERQPLPKLWSQLKDNPDSREFFRVPTDIRLTEVDESVGRAVCSQLHVLFYLAESSVAVLDFLKIYFCLHDDDAESFHSVVQSALSADPQAAEFIEEYLQLTPVLHFLSPAPKQRPGSQPVSQDASASSSQSTGGARPSDPSLKYGVLNQNEILLSPESACVRRTGRRKPAATVKNESTETTCLVGRGRENGAKPNTRRTIPDTPFKPSETAVAAATPANSRLLEEVLIVETPKKMIGCRKKLDF